MSNHDGSYLLNHMLKTIDHYGFFQSLEKEKLADFMENLRNLSWEHDCNPGEILDEIGEKLGICYECWDHGENFEDGVCEKCQKEYFY